ncbi:hypothetical protein BD289DRAFT_482528 [Coniella lustricola]|uniref:RGS domain-containing protein n=1 Tax=Coniella lustricola TaxID=2025994 RepID=A0A2T3A8G2_9PEZI|nr:hypothetical protein BD289DRAFT_482528 [Coniella lustricola]
MGWLKINPRNAVLPPLERAESNDDPRSVAHRSIGSSGSEFSVAIPEGLGFDKIIDGETCPPCTLRDFMNFLLYVEHSAENLQFYLWHRSYQERFNSTTTPDIALAPEWSQEQQDEAFAKLQREHRNGLRRNSAVMSAVLRGTDFSRDGNRTNPGNSLRLSEKHSTRFADRESNPFSTPPATPSRTDELSSTGSRSDAATWRNQAADAFAAAGCPAPFTIQPFRTEIDRVIATYIMDDAPRQLNLSARERKQLLMALSHTTHPTAFRQVARSVETTLRVQAHPNFIRWCIHNGNPPRIKLASILGISTVIGSLVAYIVLCLSSVPRGYRALPAILLVTGIATWWAGHKGICIVMHGVRRRQLSPWEIFGDDDVEMQEDDVSSSGEKGSLGRFASFGTANSYEDQPWVAKYQQRNLVRKLFDKEVWIQEPALRTVHNKIFLHSLLAGVVVGGILTAVFVCVPGGHFF